MSAPNTAPNASAARFLTARIAAVRAEMADLRELVAAGMYVTSAKTMRAALKADLADLQRKLKAVA